MIILSNPSVNRINLICVQAWLEVSRGRIENFTCGNFFCVCKQSLVSISRILQKISPRFNWDVNTPLTHTPSCEGLCQSLMRSQSVKWEGVNLCLVNWSRYSRCEVGLLLGDYYGSWAEYYPNLSSTSANISTSAGKGFDWDVTALLQFSPSHCRKVAQNQILTR